MVDLVPLCNALGNACSSLCDFHCRRMTGWLAKKFKSFFMESECEEAIQSKRNGLRHTYHLIYINNYIGIKALHYLAL